MTPIRQSQAAECTLACLAMVAGHHGLKMDLDDLRRRFTTSLKGSNLGLLAQQASTLGLTPRALQVDLHELDKLQLPCILHWRLNHVVVLERVHVSWFSRLIGVGPQTTGVTVLDPAIGRMRVGLAELTQQFSGVAMELTPGATFEPVDARKQVSLSALTGRVTGLRRSLAQLLCVAMALQLFALAAPIFNQLVVDEVLTGSDQDLLVVLSVGFCVLLMLQTVLGFARSWMMMILGQNLYLQWSGNVFVHLLRLPVKFFESRHLGDVSSRFGALGAIQGTLTVRAVEAVLDGVMAMAAMGMMLLYAPVLCAITLLATLMYGLVRWMGYQPFREAAAERLILGAREQTHFLETLRAVQPLKLFGRETERAVRWQNLMVDLQNRDVDTARMGIWFSTANAAIFGFLGIATFYLSARLVMQGVNQPSPFTVGMMFAFIAYQAQFTGRVAALIDFGVQLKMLSLHGERLADIVLEPPEEAFDRMVRSGSDDLQHLSASLELKDVSFRYGDGDPWVLRHANLVVEAGQSLAIVGASGCGKTTLLKLLLGLHAPNEGEVLYGGVPMKALGLANVRRRIGTVMQDDVLLSGSVVDNICFFDLQPNIIRAEACARVACVHDEIVKMPMGYQTLLGDLGSALSGGQRQRVLLARALYKKPSVLALDEATSHLDVANERSITKTLGHMHMTRIIIAHRPETIAGAKRVVRLEYGRLVDVLREVHAFDHTPASHAG